MKIHTIHAEKKNFEVRVGDDTTCILPLWCFDEPKKKIFSEPFLTEASEAISGLLPLGATKATLVFARKPFIGSSVKLVRGEKVSGGAYYTTYGNRKVWLCRVVKKYFHFLPKTIYASVQVTR